MQCRRDNIKARGADVDNTEIDNNCQLHLIRLTMDEQILSSYKFLDSCTLCLHTTLPLTRCIYKHICDYKPGSTSDKLRFVFGSDKLSNGSSPYLLLALSRSLPSSCLSFSPSLSRSLLTTLSISLSYIYMYLFILVDVYIYNFPQNAPS